MSSVDKMTNAEKEVAEFLDNLGLWWKYEFPLYLLDDKDRPRLYTPDFWLPKLGIYIEVCGSKRIDYDYRKKIYNKNVIKMIYIHSYKEPERWRKFLIERIHHIQESRGSKILYMTNTYKKKYKE